VNGTSRFPGGQTFHDVVVVPYAQLLDKWQDGEFHQGGPIWPDWERQVAARHCREGRPFDMLPDAPATTARYVEALAWGGGIDPQFGHQVADFSSRLLGTTLVRPELPIAFSSKPERGWRTVADTPAFFGAILEWFGIDPQRIHLVNEPTLVGELFVAPQAEQLDGPGPSEVYLDALDELAAARLFELPVERVPALYVSRAGMPARFAGETYLERILEAAGVHVMRPETLPLLEQIRAYRAAERIIFAEGSAVHVLQLLGHVDADVGVIVRRGGTHIAEANLVPRVRSLEYEDATAGMVCGILPSGRRATHLGLSVLRDDEIVDLFARLGVDLVGHWGDHAFAEARDQDVLAWADAQVAQPQLHGPGSVEQILDRLGAFGLGHLVEPVAARLEPLSAYLAMITGKRAPGGRDRATVLYMHLPRTAGGSVRASLERVIPEEERRLVYDHADVEGALRLEEFAQLPEEERASLSLVFGDFSYGLHRLIPGPARYVVTLRHPIGRIVSLYRAAGRPGSSIESWVFDDRRLDADNAMVRAISGRADVPFGGCTEGMLEDAVAHIEADFDAVLIRGSAARSAAVLGKVLGTTLPPFEVNHADPAGDDAFDPPKEVRKRLRQLNRFDVALFRRYSEAL
jgi:hypothetical protein